MRRTFLFLLFFIAFFWLQATAIAKPIRLIKDEQFNVPKHDFSMLIPAEWEFDPDTEDPEFIAPVEGNYPSRMRIVFLIPPKIAQKKVGEFIKPMLNRISPGWKLINEGYTHIGPNKFLAYFLHGKVDQYDMRRRFVIYFIWGRNGKAYQVDFYASPKYFDSKYAALKPYLETIGPAKYEPSPIVAQQPHSSSQSTDEKRYILEIEALDFYPKGAVSFTLLCSSDAQKKVLVSDCGITKKNTQLFGKTSASWVHLPAGNHTLSVSFTRENGQIVSGQVPVTVNGSNRSFFYFLRLETEFLSDSVKLNAQRLR